MGEYFKYAGTVWIVLGEGIYPGYLKCMNPNNEVRQINVESVKNG